MEKEERTGMWWLIFKKGVVYPIRIVNFAHLMTYAKSIIDAEARNTLLNLSDSDHHGCHAGGDGLRVSSARFPGV